MDMEKQDGINLIDNVVTDHNLWTAYKKVYANKGERRGGLGGLELGLGLAIAGQGEPRRDPIHPHPRRQFDRQHPGQRGQCRLADGVGEEVTRQGRRDPGVEQIDDAALRLRWQLAQESLAEQRRRPQVDRQVAVPAGGGEAFQLVRLIDRGVVDEVVQGAQRLAGLLDQLSRRFRVGQIRRQGDGAATGGFDARDERLRCRLGLAVMKTELMALGGQRFCHGVADALPGAGEQNAAHPPSSGRPSAPSFSARSQGARPISVRSRKSSMLEQRPSCSQREKMRLTLRFRVNSCCAAWRTSGSRSKSPCSRCFRIWRYPASATSAELSEWVMEPGVLW